MCRTITPTRTTVTATINQAASKIDRFRASRPNTRTNGMRSARPKVLIIDAAAERTSVVTESCRRRVNATVRAVSTATKTNPAVTAVTADLVTARETVAATSTTDATSTL